jgi:hypothetical protein
MLKLSAQLEKVATDYCMVQKVADTSKNQVMLVKTEYI